MSLALTVNPAVKAGCGYWQLAIVQARRRLPRGYQGMTDTRPGSRIDLSRPTDRRFRSSGFTLLELLVVVAIIAIGTATVSLALRDASASSLEREAQRLAALLEAGRAQSRPPVGSCSGATTAPGLQNSSALMRVRCPPPGSGTDTGGPRHHLLQLGPDPLIEPQGIVLVSASQPDSNCARGTDGLRPFTVQPGTPP